MDWFFIAFAGIASLAMLALTGHERQRREPQRIAVKAPAESPDTNLPN